MNRFLAFIATTSLAVRRGLCGAHAALIAGLSLVPAWVFPPSATQVPGMDKVVHVALYGMLGALLRWAAGRDNLSRAARALPLAGAGYGLALEWLQIWASDGSRGFTWGDVAANAVGVALGWQVLRRLSARRA